MESVLYGQDFRFQPDGDNPVCQRLVVWQPHLDVVVRESANVLSHFGVFKKDGTGLPFALPVKTVQFLIGDVQQFAHSAVFFFLRDNQGDFERLGALTFRIGEYVQARDVEAFDEVAGFLEMLFRFAPHTGNGVNADEGIRNEGFDGVDFCGEKFTGVPAAHKFEYFIATRLERNVEVGHKMPGTGDKFNDFIGEQVRFDRGDAESFYFVRFVELFHQSEEVCRLVSAEVAGVDSGQDDLFYAFCRYVPDGFPDLFRVGAPASASGVRNRAIRAEVVASVLYFQEAAGPVAERVGEVEVCQLEDVARMRFGLCGRFQVFQVVRHVEFLVGAEHQADALDVPDFFGSQLGVASDDDDIGFRVVVNDFPDKLSSFLFRHIGDAARVDDEDVGVFLFPDG